MKDVPKAVRKIPYISVAFFPSLKHNFIWELIFIYLFIADFSPSSW